MDATKIMDALAGVIMAPVRHPGLYGLDRPMYRKELRLHLTETGVAVEVDKFGYARYKRNRRYQKSTPPPPADTNTIRAALNEALPDDIRVSAVEDNGNYITIHF